jgi:uncharacterized cupredoxin-like copper-binding protein
VVRASFLAALVIAVIGVAGCGSDDDGGGTTAATTGESTSTTGQSGSAETVDVSLSDFKIDPPNPSIKAGQVTFRVKNDGATQHNLEVEGPNGETELPKNLDPGQTGTLTVDLSKPGKYEWYCPVGEHRDFGMKGEVTVGSGGGGSATGASGATGATGESGGSTSGTNTTEDSGGSGRY